MRPSFKDKIEPLFVKSTWHDDSFDPAFWVGDSLLESFRFNCLNHHNSLKLPSHSNRPAPFRKCYSIYKCVYIRYFIQRRDVSLIYVNILPLCTYFRYVCLYNEKGNQSYWHGKNTWRSKKNNDHGTSTALEGKYGLSLSAYFFTFLPIIKWEVIFWDSHLFKTTWWHHSGGVCLIGFARWKCYCILRWLKMETFPVLWITRFY